MRLNIDNRFIVKTGLVITLLLVLGMISQTSIAQQKPQDLLLIGSASLSILWWDIYDSSLYNTSGKYEGNQGPLMLSLTYQRAIESNDLVEETKSQWERFELSAEKQSKWLESLSRMWPNVTEGDNIAFYIDAKNHTHFYFNQAHIGSIDDVKFGPAFINIWLAEGGPHPKVTRGLKGQKKTKKQRRR